MFRFATTIALSAFLLFQVQPLIAKHILPWFGGTPMVWTTCMLFFQVLLLAGYGYSHLLHRLLSPRRQAVVHVTLLAISLIFLPIIPSDAWKPTGNEAPTVQILLLLLVTIGLPYFLLATTSPLVQSWFALVFTGRSPYRLFALSNFGSLVALISYPFLIEPNLRLGTQSVIWSIAYGAFAGICGWTALQSCFRKSTRDGAHQALDAEPASKQRAPAKSKPVSWTDVVMWLALSMFPSVTLLATTNQMCLEVAVIPFLWILPLSLYLISFVICFDNPIWYNRTFFTVLLLLGLIGGCFCLFMGLKVPILLQVFGYSLVLFACCMSCHGELARSRPDPQHLTLFYLMVSVGGALGGVFVVFVAPTIFLSYWELHVGLVGCLLFTLVALLRARDWVWHELVPMAASVSISGVLVAGLVVALMWQVRVDSRKNVIEQHRDFYGTVSVAAKKTWAGPPDNREVREYIDLLNGRINHGSQYASGPHRSKPTSYYCEGSGVHLSIDNHPKRMAATPAEQALRIGVIGLGTGTISGWGKTGDVIRFYEINPLVRDIAERCFFYTKDSEAEIQFVIGDARIQLEKELAGEGSQRFDILAVDAFSSDAIPMHLLTTECFELYWKHLNDDGLLAFHISNRYLDLEPVVYHLARQAGYSAVLFDMDIGEARGKREPLDSGNTWVVVTNNQAFLGSRVIQSKQSPWPREMPELIWTDDFGSLWPVLRKIGVF